MAIIEDRPPASEQQPADRELHLRGRVLTVTYQSDGWCSAEMEHPESHARFTFAVPSGRPDVFGKPGTIYRIDLTIEDEAAWHPGLYEEREIDPDGDERKTWRERRTQ